jgi:hypothetical protein
MASSEWLSFILPLICLSCAFADPARKRSNRIMKREINFLNSVKDVVLNKSIK